MMSGHSNHLLILLRISNSSNCIFVIAFVVLGGHALAVAWLRHNLLLGVLGIALAWEVVLHTLVHIVDEDGICLLNSSLFLRTLASHVVWETRVGIDLTSDSAHVVVIFSVKTTTDAWILGIVSWISIIWLLVHDILLELGVILLTLFHKNLLLTLLVLTARVRIIHLIDILLMLGRLGIRKDLVASTHRPNTLVLWLFWTNWQSVRFLGKVFFHLSVKFFSLFKDFHKFWMNFFTIKSFQDIFLMFKLILRLLCLFSSLLFLNHRIRVFWLSCLLLCIDLLAQILPMRRSSFVLSTLWFSIRSSSIWLDILWLQILLASNTQRLLVVRLVHYMHALTLIWKPNDPTLISAGLAHVLRVVVKVLAQHTNAIFTLLRLGL